MFPSTVIIGGGITGLAAAYELAVRQQPFVLLESTDRFGGLLRTEQLKGYTIECGADSMLVQKPAAIELCQEIGLEPRLIPSTPPRTAYVYANGRLHPLPSPSLFGIPGTWLGLAHFDLLPPPARVRLALGMLPSSRNAASSESADESVAHFFRRRFGQDAVDLIAQPLIGGIHAGDVERLSIKSAAPRLLADDLRTRYDAQPSLTPPQSPTARAEFRSLIGGMGELIEKIQRHLPDDAMRIRSGALDITRVGGSSPPSWCVTSAAGPIYASSVIIAAPAFAAAQLLGPLDPALADLCAATKYVSTASVSLAWPKATIAHPLDGSGFVVSRRYSDLRITACTWVSSKWEHRAPPGAALLRAFLGGAHDPDILSLSDDELTQTAIDDLSRVLGTSTTPVLSRVTRWPKAGAQHEVGHHARIAEIDVRLTRLPGIFVAGSGFRSIGIPDCIAEGRGAAVASTHYVKMAS